MCTHKSSLVEHFLDEIEQRRSAAGQREAHATQMLTLPGAAAYVDERGCESRLFMLTCKDRGALAYVGLASLVVKPRTQLDSQLAAHIAVLAACLLRDDAGAGTRP